MVSVSPGGSARLECLGSGRPDPTVVWLHEQERTFLLPGDRTGGGGGDGGDSVGSAGGAAGISVDPVTGELVAEDVSTRQSGASTCVRIATLVQVHADMDLVCFVANEVGSASARAQIVVNRGGGEEAIGDFEKKKKKEFLIDSKVRCFGKS